MEITYKLPKEVLAIIKKFQNAGEQIYIVGGAVRDILVKKEVKDWDFATSALPEVVLKLYPKGFYDNRFGTVGIAHDGQIFEITTFRKEKEYYDLRRPTKVKWAKTIEEDLARRDFTINAMALKLAISAQRLAVSLSLIDPFNGQPDLRDKVIRTVGNPRERFAEDALRLMRAIRLACELGFTIESETFFAIQKNAPLIKKISGERIRDELFKILAADYPADGFLLLRNAGLLAEIFPELERCFGVDQRSPERHHIYDVGTHQIESLKHCPSKDPLVRFATLIHDIGKPLVVGRDQKGNITFYNHEVVGAKIARNLSNRLRLSKKQREKLVSLVRWHQFTVDEATTPAAVRRFIRRVGIENIGDMLDLRVGDRLGGGLKEATSWRLRRFMKMIKEELHPPFSVIDLAISGHDVMKVLGIEPGPKVGQVLNRLFEEVVEKKDKNTREYLLKRVEEIRKEEMR